MKFRTSSSKLSCWFSMVFQVDSLRQHLFQGAEEPGLVLPEGAATATKHRYNLSPKPAGGRCFRAITSGRTSDQDVYPPKLGVCSECVAIPFEKRKTFGFMFTTKKEICFLQYQLISQQHCFRIGVGIVFTASQPRPFSCSD